MNVYDFNQAEAEKVADYIQKNPEMPEEVMDLEITFV